MTGKVVAKDPGPRGEGVIPQGQTSPSPQLGAAADPGGRGPGVPSPYAGRGEGATARPVGKRVYADVHRRAKNGDGFRITFSMDGEVFGHVNNILELPVKMGDVVFLDVLPITFTDDAVELLRRGVAIYYLRRTTLIAKRREELKLTKNTKNDVRTLMTIGDKFRRVDENFLIMRRLVAAHRTLTKTHAQLINRAKALSEHERSVLKPAIESVEEQLRVMAAKIAEEAGRRYPAYDRVVKELNINTPSAREALAELMTYVDFANSPLRGLKKLLGLYKPIRSKRKKHWRLYNGQLRQALHRLAITYYGTTPNGRQCWQLIRRLKELSTPQTQG